MIEAVNRSDLKDPGCKSLPRQRSNPRQTSYCQKRCSDHCMKLAKIILDRCSRKNDPPRSLQDPEHSRSLVVCRFETVAYNLVSARPDSSGNELRAFISDDESNGRTMGVS